MSPSTVNQMQKNSPLEVLSDFPVPLLFLDHERFPISVHLSTPRCWYHLCECLRLGLATDQGCLDAPTAWNQCLPPGAMVGVERFFFFVFFEEIQVIWLVNLQWNMLVPRCIEPCRVVWTCQVNLDTHLLDPSTTNTVHSWASARCQCWGWQFCCLRKTQPDLGNFHWQGRGGHLGPSVWQVRLLGVGQSEAMDCHFGTGRNSTRSSYPWLKGAVFLVPWKTTSCPK